MPYVPKERFEELERAEQTLNTPDVPEEPEEDDRPNVVIRLGQNRQVIEVEDRAFHLVPSDNGNALILGDETWTAQEIIDRTQGMLDLCVTWSDGASTDDALRDGIEAWREVSGK
jgi:hypothetical protein